jgi:outer membrane protein OmpA-like peptidoglycan-associated protein
LVALLAVLLIPIAGLVDIPQPGRIVDFLRTSLLGAAPALPEGQIGRIKTVSGTASITRGSQHLPATPGVPIYREDVIETGPDGSIGITFVDDSVFSTGPGSQLALSQFRFDVNDSRGNMLAELKKGTLAVVSGEITHTTPGAMSIKTPSSILGVRGTTFAVEVAVAPEEHSTQERYVVLPNADGRDGAGAITVSRGSAATTLDQPYAAAELRDGETTSIAMDAAQTGVIFQQALAARPALPSHFRLNFLLDSDQMTPESAVAYPSVVADIKKRQVYEVELIGYTDRLADEGYNKRLSIERAAAVRRALVRDGVDQNAVAVLGRGETEPLIPTARNVGEPRNRRVEISIR